MGRMLARPRNAFLTKSVLRPMGGCGIQLIMRFLKILSLAAFCAVLIVISVRAADMPLVNRGDTWRYRKGTNAPQADWKTAANAGLDSTWLSGPGGFGYADSDDATVLSDMRSNYTTIYIRKEFTIASPVDPNTRLILTMNWDDGYVAWLDGVEIKRDRSPSAANIEPLFSDVATSTHEAGTPVTNDVGTVGARLAPGVHVLSILGMNDVSTSSDLSLIADLMLRAVTTFPLVSRSDTWRYRKGTNTPASGWKTMTDAALDGTWLSGPGGIGYADSDDGTVLSDMQDGYVSVYIRRTFNVASPIDTNLHAQLVVDYDDAYVAYLDGIEIARSGNIVNGVAGVEPAFTNRASSTHEASGGGTGASPAASTALGAATGLLPPGDHVLAVIGFNESAASTDFSLIVDLNLVPAPTNSPPGSNGCVQGNIVADTTWRTTNSPITVCGNITVASGVTLTIEPGITVLFDPGLGLTVNGRLLAEGTPTDRITFTRSGVSGTWNQILFNASATTSRVAHAKMEYFAGSALEAHNTALHLDSIEWTNSTVQVVDLHTTSIVLLNSYIPGGAGNEPVHFNAMPPNGHALIKNCVFGAPRGYNDSIDFTGGNRPGPIVQFIDNVFLAGVDDCFDMDATDAHIEGNIFMNVLQDDERESSSNPISTGEGSATSELVIVRNIFFNCEHTLLLKDGGATVMQNNTIVHLVTNVFGRTAAPPGGQAIPPGIIMFGEPWRSGRTPGHGAIYEGNIAYDLHPIIQATPFPIYDPADSFLVASYSLIQNNNWPGVGNLSGNPLFASLAGPMTAQNIRSNLSLLAGSPCLGTGPNGLDMGALVPAGASISGAPASPTTNTSATLPVSGPGIWSYKWRLNGGAWSAEVSLVPQSIWNGLPLTSTMLSNTPPISLSNLTDGDYTVEVIGRNSAGFWQETNTAASVTWTVSTAGPLLITNPARAGTRVTFSFVAQAGQTYSVFYRDAFYPVHPWTKHSDIPAQGATGPYLFTDLTATPVNRFYRVASPAQP